METIQLNEIDFSKLEKAEKQGSKSTVFVDGDNCYKILDDLTFSEKIDLYYKFQAMEKDNVEVDGIIFPKILIKDSRFLKGYIMNTFPNSINLYDYFTQDRYVDVYNILMATKKASLIVRKAHEKGIILQDFSFDNILINDNFDIKICDIDGCKYKRKMSPFISMIMHNYYNVFMRRPYTVDENFDNQSLLLSMLLAIYHNMIFNMEDYDELSDKIKTLKSIRTLVNSLLNDSNTKVPYLDEIICDDDHFIIDRNRQVSLKKRLAKDYSIF